jgi:predicted histidine transporter YuiF (NhaC family)
MWPLELMVMVVLAALVSQLLRLKDYPMDEIGAKKLKELVMGFLYALVAVFLGAWLMMDQGYPMMELMSFVMLVAAGMAGMEFVVAVMNMAKSILPSPPK